MPTPDPDLICFVRDSKLQHAEKDLRSAIRWMRNQLDSAERQLDQGRPVGGGNGTTTEHLLQAIGRWDALVEFLEGAQLNAESLPSDLGAPLEEHLISTKGCAGCGAAIPLPRKAKGKT